MARATRTKPGKASRTLTHYCAKCRHPILRGEEYLPSREGGYYTVRHWPECVSAEAGHAVMEARRGFLNRVLGPDIAMKEEF